MAFRFEERPGSGNSTLIPGSREKIYYASGSADEVFVMNHAKLATPVIVASAVGNLYRQDIKLQWEAANYCTVVVPYGPRDPRLGQMHVSFATTGGTAHITASLETVNSYPAGVAPDMGQIIGVNGDDVDGCDITVPALKITVSYRHPAAFITLDQVRNLARATAYVNNDNFLGFAPGEVLFAGCDGEWGTETETSIRYEFLCSENADGAKKLTIGGIANIVKQGHDYAWVRFEDEVDGGRPVKNAKHVYVERVYRRTAFQALFGFGG